jgi:hypothetical protein
MCKSLISYVKSAMIEKNSDVNYIGGTRQMKVVRVLFSVFIVLFFVTSVSAGNIENNSSEVPSSPPNLTKFVQDNVELLSRDIAVGHGETLDALAQLMEIPAEDRGDFYQYLQANYKSIFPSNRVAAGRVFDNLVALTLAK